MPSRTRVQELIDYVEHERFLGAYREFYHDDVAVRENNGPPRIGLGASLEHEERFLSAVVAFHEVRAKSFLVDGDQAAIRWNMEVTLKDGRRIKRDEIALQRWDGEKIICEVFFYDPA